MNWTKDVPTEVGYYWMRSKDSNVDPIIILAMGGGKIWEVGDYNSYEPLSDRLEFSDRIELSNDDSVQIKDLRKITIGPDDIVVLLTNKILRAEQFETVKGQMRLAFPKNRIAILEDGMTLQILSPADINMEDKN